MGFREFCRQAWGVLKQTEFIHSDGQPRSRRVIEIKGPTEKPRFVDTNDNRISKTIPPRSGINPPWSCR